MKVISKWFCLCFLLMWVGEAWGKDVPQATDKAYGAKKPDSDVQVEAGSSSLDRFSPYIRNVLKLGLENDRLVWHRKHWKWTLPKLEKVKPQVNAQAKDKRVKKIKVRALNDPEIDKPTCNLDVHVRKLIQLTSAKQFHMGYFKKMINKGLNRKHGWKKKPVGDDFLFLREEFYGEGLFCSVEGEAERLMIFFKDNDFYEEGKSVMMKTQGLGDLRIELSDKDLMFVLDQSRNGKIHVFMARGAKIWCLRFDHFQAFYTAKPQVVHDVVFPLLADFQVGPVVDPQREMVRKIAGALLDSNAKVDQGQIEAWIEALNDDEPAIRGEAAKEIDARYVQLMSWVSQQKDNPELSLEGQALLKEVYRSHEETRRVLRDMENLNLLHQPAFLVALLKKSDAHLSEKIHKRLNSVSGARPEKAGTFDWAKWWRNKAHRVEDKLGG